MYAGPGGNHMKNTFVVNGLSITIEGQPIAIDKLEVTSEMSAQELATSGGLIKALVGELKPLIQEAVKPVAIAPTPTPTPAPANNYNRNNNHSNNYKNNNYNKGNYNKNDNHKDLQKIFSGIQKPECLTEKDSEWKWKASDSYNNRCSVCVQNDEFNVVRIHIMSHNCWIHIHKYPSETKIDGCRFDQLPEFMKWSGIPDELQSYILKVVAL